MLWGQVGSLIQPCFPLIFLLVTTRGAQWSNFIFLHTDKPVVNFCTANIFLLWQCLEALLGIQTWHCNNQVTVSQTAVLFLAHMYSWFPTTLLQSVNLQTEGTDTLSETGKHGKWVMDIRKPRWSPEMLTKPQKFLSVLACLFYSIWLNYKPCIRLAVITSHLDFLFQCSYVPDKLENSKEVKARIETIASNFKKYHTFPCYYDPGGTQTNVILSRLYPPKGLLFAFLWPTLMFTGGCLIIVLVKISQYVSVLSAWQ